VLKPQITVEVNMDKGLVTICWPAGYAIRERYTNSGSILKTTATPAKITINMAPADLRKEGSAYDLTLTIGILVVSSNQRMLTYIMGNFP
jgi:magnesium chelatase family protein